MYGICERARTVILAIILLFVGFSNPVFANPASPYERVMQTNTLRCAYLVWPPYITKEPNTAKLSGVMYDLVEQLGKALNLKIEWTQEYVVGTQIETLKSKKVDALCGDGPWTRSALPFVRYSHPLLFFPTYIHVKKGSKLANITSLDQLNSAAVKFSQMDGDLSQDLAMAYFPNARSFSLPSTAEPTLLMENIAQGKADVLIQDLAPVLNYNKNAKIPLVSVQAQKPLAVYPEVITALPEDETLIDLLNRGIDFLNDTGVLTKIIKQYDPELKSFIPPRERY